MTSSCPSISSSDFQPLQPSLFESYGGPCQRRPVFARVRTGDTCFAGRVADARGTINPDLSGNSSLVKRKLTAAEESDWKDYIEELGREISSTAALKSDPRDYPEDLRAVRTANGVPHSGAGKPRAL